MRRLRFVALAAFAIASLVLTACTSKVDAAFQRCVDRQVSKLEKQAERGSPQVQQSVKEQAPKLAEAVCGPIKKLCKDDWDGTMCQQTLDSLGAKESD